MHVCTCTSISVSFSSLNPNRSHHHFCALSLRVPFAFSAFDERAVKDDDRVYRLDHLGNKRVGWLSKLEL